MQNSTVQEPKGSELLGESTDMLPQKLQNLHGVRYISHVIILDAYEQLQVSSEMGINFLIKILQKVYNTCSLPEAVAWMPLLA